MVLRDYDPDDFDEDDPCEEGWGDDSDEEATMPCPHCLRPVFEDAELCPSCGQYLSREDAPSRKPWWLVLGVMVCLAMTFWWVLHP